MKKRVLIGSTIIALVLSVSLLTVSVLAAMGQVFGVNNKIVFLGVEQYVHCIINAEITGTTRDGAPELEYTWEYNYADSEKDAPRCDWGIGELVFNQKGVAPGEERISYTFTVQNLSDNTRIRVYIEDPTIDEDVLKYEIDGGVGQEKEIPIGQTAIVSAHVMPKNGEFSGARECNIMVRVEQV